VLPLTPSKLPAWSYRLLHFPAVAPLEIVAGELKFGFVLLSQQVAFDGRGVAIDDAVFRQGF
jgi:hypothetical protein